MKVGDVCLTAIPQANGKEKLRPVMLMSQLPGFGDWLVCGISSHRIVGRIGSLPYKIVATLIQRLCTHLKE